MLEELQEKIYSVFPRVKEPAPAPMGVAEQDGEQDESLAGARMFASDICQRYNAMVTDPQLDAEKKEDDVAEKRVEEFVAKLKLNMDKMMMVQEDTKVFNLYIDRIGP